MKVQGSILKGIIQGISQFHIREADFLERLGLEAIQEQEMYDWTTGVRCWEIALELGQYRFISLSMGMQANFTPLGWVAPLTSSSENLGAAWSTFCDFALLMGNMFNYRLERLADGSCRILFEPHPAWLEASPLTAQLATEHAMSLCISLSAYLSGKPVVPLEAAFVFEETPDLSSQYRPVFGKQLRFAQPAGYLLFDKATAALPVISANALMYRQLQAWCREQLQSLRQEADTREQILALLYRQPAHYLPKLGEVASQLRIGERTLQRKLKEAGTNYQLITEEYRESLALQLLQRKDLQVQDIAYMLGFQDPESFRKAFKKRTGMSPKAFRQA